MNKTVVSMMIAAVALFCLAGTLAAATTNVTYTAAGTFATPALSGADMLKLAGYPYSISVYLPETATPSKTGTGYAVYSNVQMYGQVFSGLLNTTAPFGCAPSQTGCTAQLSTLLLQIGTKGDQIEVTANIPLIGLTLTVTAKAPMPLGTITSTKIRPFTKTVTTKSPSTTVIYKDTTASTTLGANGTVATTTFTSQAPTGEASALTPPATMPAVALVSRRRYV